MRYVHGAASVQTADAEISTEQFADDVRYYLSLTPRQLPSRYLYDALGSALFDAICELPWYEVTRGETRLLHRHAREVFGTLRPVDRVIELGAGNGRKLETLLASAAPADLPRHAHLIDVSAQALRTAADALGGFSDLRLFLHEAPYEAGLEQIAAGPGPARRSLVLFLGSNIGNFDPPSARAMLRQIRGAINPGDGFLVGADLAKPEPQLLLAYDDPLQVTAAFNRNLLVRINRELGGNFDLDRFTHRAIWNQRESRVEMHLVSTTVQEVRIRAADLALSFEEGETIWTESSYKYEPDALAREFGQAGFSLTHQWVDEAARFALTLLTAV